MAFFFPFFLFLKWVPSIFPSAAGWNCAYSGFLLPLLATDFCFPLLYQDSSTDRSPSGKGSSVGHNPSPSDCFTFLNRPGQKCHGLPSLGYVLGAS